VVRITLRNGRQQAGCIDGDHGFQCWAR
jgi:hypothetical protein